MFKRFFFGFGVLMVILFVTLGIGVLVAGQIIMPEVHPVARIVFGVTVIVYGFFRAYRYYSFYKTTGKD